MAELLARSRDPLAPVEPTQVAEVVESARTGRWAELARDHGRPLEVRAEPGLPSYSPYFGADVQRLYQQAVATG